jgi:hypothetical protein
MKDTDRRRVEVMKDRVIADMSVEEIKAEIEKIQRLTARRKRMNKIVSRQMSWRVLRYLGHYIAAISRVTRKRLHYVWFDGMPDKALYVLCQVHYHASEDGTDDEMGLFRAAKHERDRRYPARVGLPNSRRTKV